MRHASLACLLLFVAVAAPAYADPAGILVAKAEEEADATTSDPTNATTPQGLQEDAQWAIAYPCHVIATAEDETGAEAPDLEGCEDHEAVIGIAPQEEEAAIVEPAEEGAEAVAAATIADAETALVTILDGPTSAPDEAVGLIERTIDRVVGFITDVIGGIGHVFIAIGTGIGTGALAIVDGIVWTVTAVGTGIGLGMHWIGGWTFAIVDGVTTTLSAIASGVSAAATTLWDGTLAVGTGTVALVTDAVDAVVGLFADGSTATTQGTSRTADPLRHQQDALGLGLPLDTDAVTERL